MKTIYKFPLSEFTGTHYIDIPGFDRILSFGLDPHGRLCVWALCQPELPATSVKFLLAFTSDRRSFNDLTFVGTCLGYTKVFVWHLFVEKKYANETR